MRKIIIVLFLLLATSCFADNFISFSFTPFVNYKEVNMFGFDNYNFGFKFMKLGRNNTQQSFNLGFSAEEILIFSVADTKFKDLFSSDVVISQMATNLQVVPSYKKVLNDENNLYLYAGFGINAMHVNIDYNLNDHESESANSFGYVNSCGVKLTDKLISYDITYEYMKNKLKFDGAERKDDWANHSVMLSIAYQL